MRFQYVKDALNIGDQFDSTWPVDGPFDVANPPTPAEFGRGVFVGDPMRDVIDVSADPGAFVEGLVANGYPAALFTVDLIDLTNDCVGNDVLTFVAEGIDIEVVEPVETAGSGETFAYEQIQALGCWICITWTWTISGPTLTGCTCTWNAAPTSCEWNALRCATVCHWDGSSTCTYTRVRKKRKWDCTTCTWTETGTKTGNVKCTSTTYNVGPNGCLGDPGPAFVAPAGPDCNCPEPITGGITWAGNPPC